MREGLMQLTAYGARDVFLTANPEITFYKVNYRKTECNCENIMNLRKYKNFDLLFMNYNKYGINLDSNIHRLDLINMNLLDLNDNVIFYFNFYFH